MNRNKITNVNFEVLSKEGESGFTLSEANDDFLVAHLNGFINSDSAGRGIHPESEGCARRESTEIQLGFTTDCASNPVGENDQSSRSISD